MKQHSIGPWKVNHEGTTDEGDHLRHDFSVQTPLCDHDNEVGLATAKLIAAAPDMLQALAVVIEFHDHIRGMSLPRKENDMRIRLRTFVKDAIKKATQ